MSLINKIKDRLKSLFRLKKKQSKVDPDDLEFMAEARAAMLMATPQRAHWLLWSVIIFLVCAVIWTTFAEVDEVVQSQATVIPSQQIQVIQNLEGGILSEIFVKDGDNVSADQALLRIDDTQFKSDFRESSQQLANLMATQLRLKAEINQKEPDYPEAFSSEYPDIVAREYAFFETRKADLDAVLNIHAQQLKQREQELAEAISRRNTLQRNYQIARKEYNMTRPLVDEGIVSRVEILKLQREVNQLRGDLDSAKLSIPRTEAKIAEAKQKFDEISLKFISDSRDELNDVSAELERLTESMVMLKDRVSRTMVTSPVNGIVKQVMVTTVGGVIQPGMDIMEIVPTDDKLLLEAKVKPDKIAFIRPELDAMVKLSAYDFTIYGGLKGVVEQISADTITDEQGESFYLVRVRTYDNFLEKDGKRLEIIPGMQAQVDILTGKKTILEYLAKPLLRAKQQALRER